MPRARGLRPGLWLGALVLVAPAMAQTNLLQEASQRFHPLVSSGGMVAAQEARAAAVGAASSDVAVNPAARNAVIPRYVISPRFVMSLWNLSGRPSGNSVEYLVPISRDPHRAGCRSGKPK